MTWNKRQVAQNLVILGDDEGHVRRAHGLLADVTPDPQYPNNRRYLLIGQAGAEKIVAGSTSLNLQVGPGDVGKFVKFSFVGWERGKRGRFKAMEVEVYDGPATKAMLDWLGPEGTVRYKQLNGNAPRPLAAVPAGASVGAAAPEDFPPEPSGDDDLDDLPF